MRQYGRVETGFWSHPGVRQLSDHGRLLYLFLLTGPHTNMSGCFKAPMGYIAEDLGWVPETVSEGFAELFREGFANYDETHRFVFVKDFLKFNRIDNGNVAKAMMVWFREVPDASTTKGPLAADILEHVHKLPAELRPEIERFAKGYAEGLPKSGNREQGTENREKKEESFALVVAEGPRPTLAKDAQIAFDEWNAMASQVGIPTARSLTNDRKRHIVTRLKEVGLDGWRDALAKVAASPHCCGQNERGWKADLDFLFQNRSWNRVLEGFYDARQGVAANQNRPGAAVAGWSALDQAVDGYELDHGTEEAA